VVPDFSTLSRRQKTLKVNIPWLGSDGPLHLLIASTGIKVASEWNARKHGGAKRRVWRRIHIGIDEKSLEIRAVEFTTSDVGDAPMLPSTPASAMMRSPPEAQPRSSCPARTPSPKPPVPSHETQSCGRQNALVKPSGGDGAATIAAVAQKPRCTASSCWGSGYPPGTSTVGSQGSKS
jgi:hypothetical protein